MKLYLITVGIRDSGNLGALARLAHNFQIDGLIAVAPDCEVDDLAYERATHGRLYLDNLIVLESMAELSGHVDYSIALTARIGGTRNYVRKTESFSDVLSEISILPYRSVGLIFGRESSGLTNEELSRCDRIATIFASPGHVPVLNISHAAAISLYETRKNLHKLSQSSEYELIHSKTKAAILENFSLVLSSMSKPSEWVENMLLTLRRILSRCHVTQDEGNKLVGLSKSLVALIGK